MLLGNIIKVTKDYLNIFNKYILYSIFSNVLRLSKIKILSYKIIYKYISFILDKYFI